MSTLCIDALFQPIKAHLSSWTICSSLWLYVHVFNLILVTQFCMRSILVIHTALTVCWINCVLSLGSNCCVDHHSLSLLLYWIVLFVALFIQVYTVFLYWTYFYFRYVKHCGVNYVHWCSVPAYKSPPFILDNMFFAVVICYVFSLILAWDKKKCSLSSLRVCCPWDWGGVEISLGP